MNRADSRAVRGLPWFVLAVITGSVAVRSAWLAGTWFKQDDLAFRFNAHQYGLDFGYLFTRRDGHFMPGALTQVWLFEKVFGASWWPIVAWCAALQIAAAWLAWKFFAEVFGKRPAGLVFVAALLWNPLTLDATMWWASAMQFLPLQVAFFGLLLAFRRAISLYSGPFTSSKDGESQNEPTTIGGTRQTQLGASAIVGGVFLVGLLFSEKLLLLAVFIVLVGIATPLGPSRFPLTVRIRAALMPVGVLCIVALMWAVLYFTAEKSCPACNYAAASLEGAYGSGWKLFAYSVLPSLAGGPWRWTSDVPSLALAAPSKLAVSGVLFVMAAICVFSIIRRPRVSLLWMALVVYFVLLIMALASPGSGRISALGELAGRVPRYGADAVLATLLVLILASLQHPMESQQVPDSQATSGRHWSNWELGGTAAVCFVLVLSAIWSSTRLVDLETHAPAQAYSKAALNSVSAENGRIDMLPGQPTPAEVLNSLYFPGATTRTVLAPLSERFRFAEVVNEPRLVLQDGRIVPARISGLVVGDGKSCVARVTRGQTEYAELPTNLFPWPWYMTVSYRTDRGGHLATALGSGPKVRARTRAPSGSITFQSGGEGRRISLNATSGSVCITQLRVGNAEPADGPGG